MAKVRISNRLYNISISEIEQIFKAIIYPNHYEYMSKGTIMYSFEDNLVWITCEISKLDKLSEDKYHTYFILIYNNNFENSIDYIKGLIDILDKQNIEVHLECEIQDDNGNVLKDEFIIKNKEDLTKTIN